MNKLAQDAIAAQLGMTAVFLEARLEKPCLRCDDIEAPGLMRRLLRSRAARSNTKIQRGAT